MKEMVIVMNKENFLINEYKSSKFYDKYKDTYVSDKILKEIFNCRIKTHRLCNIKTYLDAHSLNVNILRDFLNLFANEICIKNNEILLNMILAFYIDPDSYAIKEIGNTDCYADGLLSIKRIYKKHGLSEVTIDEYEKYRSKPIFFFPREKGGINTSRLSEFGDRIDHTLFDLKKYYQGEFESCKLKKAYKLPKTSQWLDNMGSFENIIDEYKVKGIFTNNNYEVYDLEKGNESIIIDYNKKYSYCWSDAYYDNLKNKIDEFIETHSIALNY